MTKNERNWGIIDLIVTGGGALLSLLGIYTSIKATKYNEEIEDQRLEQKYGLTAIEEKSE